MSFRAPLRWRTVSDTSPDHYFTAQPASSDERRLLTVRLDGADREVETAGGIFSPGRIDLGTQVLLRTVGTPADGDVLDLGCGWGPVALTMALRNPGATVWAVDVNERALDLVRRNAARLGLTNVRAVGPDEVPDDVTFATIWSNPPIRVGKDTLHAMMDRWVPRLAAGASAYLVVQRNLGADSFQAWLARRFASLSPAAADGDASRTGAHVERLGSAKGFRVLRVQRP